MLLNLFAIWIIEGELLKGGGQIFYLNIIVFEEAFLIARMELKRSQWVQLLKTYLVLIRIEFTLTEWKSRQADSEIEG